MEKHKDLLVFFSDKGLTSTSANHVANLAKEYVSDLESKMNSLSLIYTDVTLLSHCNPVRIVNEHNTLNSVIETLNNITEATALQSWLREAISARNTLLESIHETYLVDYCKMKDKNYPEIENYLPSHDMEIDEADYWSSKSVGERCKYYSLEAEASVIGKFIHNNGKFKVELEKFKEVRGGDIKKITGEGVDAMIFSSGSTFTDSYINDTYFLLQNKHRKVQAELNSMKYECNKAIKESRSLYQTEREKAFTKFNSDFNVISEEYTSWKHEMTCKINDYKIIIPNNLQDVYEKINKLGK